MEASRIIIVGSGFAGVTLAEHLTRRIGRDVEVVVISSENHMVFTPTACGGGGPFPFRARRCDARPADRSPGHLVNGHSNQRRSKEE